MKLIRVILDLFLLLKNKTQRKKNIIEIKLLIFSIKNKIMEDLTPNRKAKILYQIN